MANPAKGEIEFVAGGRKYILQYSHESLIRLEDKMDRGLMMIMKDMESWSKDPEKIRLGTIRTILWAGLLKHQPDVTMEEAADLIGEVSNGIVGTIELIGLAFQKAFAAPETKGTNPPSNPMSGIGTNSGSSGSASDIPLENSGKSLLANTSFQ